MKILITTLMLSFALFAEHAQAMTSCLEASQKTTVKQQEPCNPYGFNIVKKKPRSESEYQGIDFFRIFNDDDQPLIWDVYTETMPNMIWYEDGERKTGEREIISKDILIYPGAKNRLVMDKICQQILDESYVYDYQSAAYKSMRYPWHGNATSFYTQHEDGKTIVYKAFDWDNYQLCKDDEAFLEEDYLSPQKNHLILKSFTCREITEEEKKPKKEKMEEVVIVPSSNEVFSVDEKIDQILEDPEIKNIILDFSNRFRISLPYAIDPTEKNPIFKKYTIFEGYMYETPLPDEIVNLAKDSKIFSKGSKEVLISHQDYSSLYNLLLVIGASGVTKDSLETFFLLEHINTKSMSVDELIEILIPLFTDIPNEALAILPSYVPPRFAQPKLKKIEGKGNPGNSKDIPRTTSTETEINIDRESLQKILEEDDDE